MKSYASQIQSLSHKSGARVFVYPFGHSDTVSVTLSVAGGYYLTDNPLVADSHAALLMDGTKKRSKREIQEFLDSFGAQLSFSASFDRLEAAIRVRRAHLKDVLGLCVEMLCEPTFPQKELTVIKKQIAGALEAEAENTREQASQALSELLFERSHPNFSHTTKEKETLLAAVSRKNILTYHDRLGGLESLIAACAGAVEDMEPQALLRFFDTLQQKENTQRSALPVPKPSREGGKGTVFVRGKANIDYMVGLRFGITRAHEDYPALVLAARILGNPGFTGRLMKTIREKEGLTYGAYAFMRGFDSQADGALVVWSTFAPSLFAQGRAAVMREIKKLIEEGPTETEFKEHRDLFLANWHVRLTKSGAFSQALHDAAAEHEPLDYLDSFPKCIAGVLREDVIQALRQYWSAELLSEAAAGAVEKDALAQ